MTANLLRPDNVRGGRLDFDASGNPYLDVRDARVDTLVKRNGRKTTKIDLTLDANTQYVFCDASLQPITLTLPDAGQSVLPVMLKQVDDDAENPVMVRGTRGQKIDREDSLELDGSVTLMSDGSNWWSV